jgi:hypothetical protein
VSGNGSEAKLSHDAAFTGAALARPINKSTPEKMTLERTKPGAIAREDIVGVFTKRPLPVTFGGAQHIRARNGSQAEAGRLV